MSAEQTPIPDVPLRMELTFELPGTPEQVWDAIATAEGISSWFLRTEMDEREGGALTIHMGDTSSEGTVTRWDPPRRLVYEEPDWATLSGHEGAPVTPMVSEFLVEAQSGGSCVLRVVSSAYGTGADWENEFFEDMAKQWAPYFDNLRMYLVDYPGQHVTPFEASTSLSASADAALAAMLGDLGAAKPGQPVEARGLKGTLQRTDPAGVLVRVDEPVDGFLSFYAHGDERESVVSITGWLFSDNAAEYVRQQQPEWQAWIENLAVATA
jgi:uncharacterized protein YndB with AHSA1/START domain